MKMTKKMPMKASGKKMPMQAPPQQPMMKKGGKVKK